MANIFKLTKDYVNPPKRNSYDLSYQNDFTAKFGILYPIFIKEVNPGDSFSIQTNLGIRAEPMVFPVQSKIRADVHYFYVRNRTLWENWMDFIGKVDDSVEHPYIERSPYDFKTGSIYDYLGVPTSIVGESSFTNNYAINPFNYLNTRNLSTVSSTFNYATLDSFITYSPLDLVKKINRITYSNSSPIWIREIGYTVGFSLYGNNYVIDRYSSVYNIPSWLGPAIPIGNLKFLSNLTSSSINVNNFPSYQFPNISSDFTPILNSDKIRVYYFISKSSFDFSNLSEFQLLYTGLRDTLSLDFVNGKIVVAGTSPSSTTGWNIFCQSQIENGYDIIIPLFAVDYNSENPSSLYEGVKDGTLNIGSMVTVSNLITPESVDTSTLTSLPWCGSNKDIKLSALPFRAYEAIYNSYYRNYMNNPFMLNGKPQYNRYVTNLGDGADPTPYKLFNRNWELDFLTSAQQSPQQGEAPLVGITINPNSTATMKFKSSELASSGVVNGEVTATVEIDENTNVLGISYYDEQLPQSNLKRLMEAINYGISINDLRQTTALQRWLEKNILKGYRYIDQIKSHFGVDVSYRDLLMPEFIGGHSQNVNTITISQTTPTGDSPLGSYGGQAISKSSSENTVTKYCDEAGFIVGIMSIVPTPVYSQIPQQFLYKMNVLDYYFPEFGSIGMQPIFNKDITPLQTDRSKLEDVFGYQRPWWHLISSIDEVHGEFRTNRQGYLIQRLFSETPVLNGDFLSIKNDAINNVFYVDDDLSDQFLCQAYFKVTKKTAIPLFGVPAIENADVN